METKSLCLPFIISYAMAVTKLRAVPVLVDSDLHTWNMKVDPVGVGGSRLSGIEGSGDDRGQAGLYAGGEDKKRFAGINEGEVIYRESR